MTILFGQILNMSLTASIIILLVMAARLILKKAPKIYSYALWAVVLFRLLCPVALTAPVSVLEVAAPQVTQSEGISYVAYEAVENVLIESEEALPKVQTQPISIQESQQLQEDTAPTVMEIASWLWLGGMAVMLLHSFIAWIRLRLDLVGAVHWKGKIWLADHIGSPFVMGILSPKVYLPSDTPMEERRYIIAHECHHIRRFDHILKLLAYAALCLHWFNPLVWAAFVLAGKDMEMSCDEAVINRLGTHIRADYSASLLRLATHKRIIAGTPLAFGEGDTKGRVKNMAKWKKPKVGISVLCAVLCIIIVVVCALNPAEEKRIEEMTRTTNEGPTGCVYGNLNYTLPGGITHELREIEGYDEGLKKVLRGEENRNIHIGVWSVDGVEIGGIRDHLLPEGTSTADLDWIHSLELREWENENLGYFAGSSVYGIAEAEFFTDVPPGTEIEPVERKHYFFLDEDGRRIYDLWFDMLTVDTNVRETILKSAAVGGESPLPVVTNPDSSIESIVMGTIPPNYSIQISQFPQGYTFEMDGYGNFLFLEGTATIGGLTSYAIPEGVYDPADEVFKWLEEVGIPDYEDSSLAYMGGMTFLDNEWSAEFASDVPEGEDPTVYRHHYFRVIGNRVFDCWFDLLQIDWDTCMEIRDAVKVTDNTEPGETEALYRCHAVLKAVQSGSSHLALERHYDAGISDYTQEYLQHRNGDHNEWLSIITVQIAGTVEKHANLYAGGTYFSNMGKWSEEEILWTEMMTEAEPLRPWLTTYQWNEETVAYMDTLTDESGTCIMLRIDEPFDASTEGEGEHYFVNFYFDPQGNFLNTKITVALFTENEFTQTEAIVTLENLSVYHELDEEYQRAAGKSLTGQIVEGSPVVTDTVLYQTSFESDEGTVSISINALLSLEELEKYGLTVEAMQSVIEQKFRAKTVDSYGLNTTAMGYEGATCQIRITDIKPGGDYLVAADKAVPTIEVWGTRTYVFANGDRLGEEQDTIQLLMLNAQDGTILISFGEKN